jgi:uroporphyrinogen-III decarboxylase
MTPQESTELGNKRVLAALNLETPDRIPIFMAGQGFFQYVDPQATLADYFRRPEYVDDLLIQAAALPILDKIDGPPRLAYVTKPNMDYFAGMIFAKMRLPGVELPDTSLWNVDEKGPMTEADYDTIIAKGWGYMTEELNRRIDLDPASIPPPDMEYMAKLREKMAPLGKPTVGPKAKFMLPFPPFETVSGARKLNNFIRDLRRIPEKVRAALDIIEDYEVEKSIKLLEDGPHSDYAFIGGTRSGSSFISPAVFEKFYFPYYQKLVPAMQKIKVKTWLHMDNDWSGFLHYFREFDKAQCVWDPDQMTPILKIKEVLGDKMCIDGNISPALLAVGTPDQCYAAAKEQIEQVGKTGYTLSVGCVVPVDAKRANVEAVISAGLDA